MPAGHMCPAGRWCGIRQVEKEGPGQLDEAEKAGVMGKERRLGFSPFPESFRYPHGQRRESTGEFDNLRPSFSLMRLKRHEGNFDLVVYVHWERRNTQPENTQRTLAKAIISMPGRMWWWGAIIATPGNQYYKRKADIIQSWQFCIRKRNSSRMNQVELDKRQIASCLWFQHPPPLYKPDGCQNGRSF